MSQAEALRLAAETSEPVLLESATTSYVKVMAQPDGTLEASTSLSPARMKMDGQWRELNSALEEVSDGFSPKVAENSLVISDGGNAGSPLVTYTDTDNDTVYELQAPFDLPEPEVEGATATFHEVKPGLDIVVVAKNAGWAYYLVVNDRAAAEALGAEVRFPVRLVGLDAHEVDGGTELVDDAGKRVGWHGTPVMWDASGDDETGDSPTEALEGPVAGDQVAAFAAKTSLRSTSSGDERRGEMVLSMVDDVLTSPQTTYPAIVDPAYSYTKGRSGWTAVWNNYPTKSFWQTAHSLGAGYEGWEQNKIVRSYFRFPLSSTVHGTKIVSAEMNVKQVHAAQCADHATEVYRTDPIGTATTWNAQPARGALQSTSYSRVGCGAGSGMVGWDVAYGTQNAVRDGASTVTFMIRGKSEANKYAWKQFEDADANLAIRYAPYPKTASPRLRNSSTNTDQSCGTSTSPQVVSSQQVSLGAYLTSKMDTDGDSGTVDYQRAVLYLENLTTGSTATKESDTFIATPGIRWVDHTAGKGYSYRFRVKGRMYYGDNLAYHLDSVNWSSYCYFRVDATAPGEPTLDSTAFPECATASSSSVCDHSGNRVGASGTFTVTANSDDTDVTKYEWRYSKALSTSHTISTSNSAAKTFSVTPTAHGTQYVEARAYDLGSRSGGWKKYWFYVPPNAPLVKWDIDKVDAPEANTGLEPTSGALDLAGSSATVSPYGRDDKGLRFSGGAPVRASSIANLDTRYDFTVAAWVRVDGAETDSATLLAAPASTGNAFELGYDAASGKWVAGRRGSGAPEQTVSSAPALLGVWTHLAAGYDQATNKMALWVNGVQVSSKTYSSAATASTGWQLGCGNTALTVPGCGTGMVDEVQIWNNIPIEGDIKAALKTETTDTRDAYALAADWDFEQDTESSGRLIDQIYGAPLAVSGMSAGWLTDQIDGQPVRALTLPGTTAQSVKIGRPVVDTTASFSIAGLVRLEDLTTHGVIAQQSGASAEAWTLGYRPKSDGTVQFYFQMRDSSGSSVSEARYSILDPAEVGQFAVVIGVYDEANDQVRVYFNGMAPIEGDGSADADHTGEAFGAPWLARGAMNVGNGHANGTTTGTSAPMHGQVAALRLFAGALNDNDVLVDDVIPNPGGTAMVAEEPVEEPSTVDEVTSALLQDKFGDGAGQ
jgi:hypothetical protein